MTLSPEILTCGTYMAPPTRRATVTCHGKKTVRLERGHGGGGGEQTSDHAAACILRVVACESAPSAGGSSRVPAPSAGSHVSALSAGADACIPEPVASTLFPALSAGADACIPAPVVLFGRTFSDRETLLGLVVASFVAFYFTSVASLAFPGCSSAEPSSPCTACSACLRISISF
uniref:Uncharacterized protein n=1 Tax=Oryza brachyantha TaxID=4533 RepID=J3LAR8_ORYBR